MGMRKVEVFLTEEQIEKLKEIDRVRGFAIRKCVEEYLKQLEENKK